MSADRTAGRRLVPIGFGSTVMAERVLTILNPAGAPVRRLRDEARQKGLVIDATQGRKTRSIIVLDSHHLVLSALQPETLAQRLERGREPLEEDDEP